MHIVVLLLVCFIAIISLVNMCRSKQRIEEGFVVFAKESRLLAGEDRHLQQVYDHKPIRGMVSATQPRQLNLEDQY